MNRWILLLIPFIAASWSLLLLPWVAVGEQTLTGAELSDLSTLLPALAILILLISLYGKLTKLLKLMSVVALWLGAYLALSTDFSTVAASIALQESITGVAGESSLGQSLATSAIFGVSQIVAGILCLALLKVPASRGSRSDNSELDPRGLWESQS